MTAPPTTSRATRPPARPVPAAVPRAVPRPGTGRRPRRIRAALAGPVTVVAVAVALVAGAVHAPAQTDPTVPDTGPVSGPIDPTSTTVVPSSTTTSTSPDGASTTTTVAPDPSTATTDPNAPPPVIDPRLSPNLALLPLDSPDVATAMSRYRSAWARQVDAQQRQADAEAQLGDLAAARVRLRDELTETQRRHDKSAARLEALRSGARELAVASFMRGSSNGSTSLGLNLSSATAEQAGKALVASISATQLNDIEVHASIVAATAQVIASDTGALADVEARQRDQAARRQQAIDDLAAATDAVQTARQGVADVRMTAMVSGTDLSLVALDAYWRAAQLAAISNPECHLRWQAIAGVGRVETLHGRYGGGPVNGAGEVDPPIIGVALDGSNGTAAIPDSDGGAIDHDPVWDRAVGPMAFIPSSWRAFGRDGNGDGVADVQNIYDASVATAGLLCRYGPLDDDAHLRTAYFHYNQSQVYVDMVLGFTHTYDQLVIPTLPAAAGG